MNLDSIYQVLASSSSSLESKAREIIDVFYREARYDGGRFRYPSFQEVSKTWLDLVKAKESALISEFKRLFDSMPSIDASHVLSAINACDSTFREEDYVERLIIFRNGIARIAGSYGLNLERLSVSFDVFDAAYRAAMKNSLRDIRKNVSAELQIYLSHRSVGMGFSSLMTDTITILKKDGARWDSIKASVQTGKIFIHSSDYLIESGDLVQRKMSNGGQETFEVIDPGFHEQFHGIPAGYQMVVKKLGIPEANQAVQHITYNISGHNSRINQGSIDNSKNSVRINTEAAEHIAALRSFIQNSELENAEKSSAMEVIVALDSQFESGKPSGPVVTALLAALPRAAEIATIATALLSLL